MGHPDLCPVCRAPISEAQRAKMDKATSEQYIKDHGVTIYEGPEMCGPTGPSGPMISDERGIDGSTG